MDQVCDQGLSRDRADKLVGGKGEDGAVEGPPVVVLSGLGDRVDGGIMRVESSFARGFSGLNVIGNASQVARDGLERARSALEALGYRIPPRRIVVSLTPADIRKEGCHLDLPMAVSLAFLVAPPGAPGAVEGWAFAAELGLGGVLRPVKGVVSLTLAAIAGGLKGVAVAEENRAEVLTVVAQRSRLGAPFRVLGFSSLGEVLGWLSGARPDQKIEMGETLSTDKRDTSCEEVAPNFDDMILPPALERVVSVAATGMHNLFLRGSPGTGKSMLAARIPSILPPLGAEEHLAAMRVYSSMQVQLPPGLLGGQAPFRAPHHQASAAAVMGTADVPGEIALAHGGVLFLDEFPEFRRDVLEALREPLETGEVRVARSQGGTTWVARVMLVAACNNCPCGWAGSARRLCRCPSARLLAYRARLSGPVLERIDMHVNVPESGSSAAGLFVRLGARTESAAPTARLKVLVARARERTRERGVSVNRDLGAGQLVAVSGLSVSRFEELVNGIIPATASRRSAVRCLRVARTLADLDGADAITGAHIAEAWQWQPEPSARARGECL